MLVEAKPEDWLLWRRTYDGFGYSPLAQVTTDNVDDLRVVWTWSLPPGPAEATPLVHDGVMFVHGYGDHVQALDATTGDLLWHYSRRLPRAVAPSLKRGSRSTARGCMFPRRTPTSSRSTSRPAPSSGTVRSATSTAV